MMYIMLLILNCFIPEEQAGNLANGSRVGIFYYIARST